MLQPPAAVHLPPPHRQASARSPSIARSPALPGFPCTDRCAQREPRQAANMGVADSIYNVSPCPLLVPRGRPLRCPNRVDLAPRRPFSSGVHCTSRLYLPEPTLQTRWVLCAPCRPVFAGLGLQPDPWRAPAGSGRRHHLGVGRQQQGGECAGDPACSRAPASTPCGRRGVGRVALRQQAVPRLGGLPHHPIQSSSSTSLCGCHRRSCSST